MTLLEAAFLGIIQGLTEFLPVSSSGHLVLAQNLFGVRGADLFFDVMLHMGTLFATLWFFRRDIARLLKSLIGNAPADAAWLGGAGGGLRYIAWIIVATVPAGIVGAAFEDKIEGLFHNPRLVCVNLIITGVVLLAASLRGRGNSLIAKSQWWKVLLIGIAQAVAIAPGISRSGATIAAALLLGADRDEATRFSFLLSIPAILGAAVLGAKDLSAAGMSEMILPTAAGMATAFAFGIAALHVIVAAVRGKSLIFFTPYCWAIAIVGLIALR